MHDKRAQPENRNCFFCRCIQCTQRIMNIVFDSFLVQINLRVLGYASNSHVCLFSSEYGKLMFGSEYKEGFMVY